MLGEDRLRVTVKADSGWTDMGQYPHIKQAEGRLPRESPFRYDRIWSFVAVLVALHGLGDGAAHKGSGTFSHLRGMVMDFI